jgi:hypothetical protein
VGLGCAVSIPLLAQKAVNLEPPFKVPHHCRAFWEVLQECPECGRYSHLPKSLAGFRLWVHGPQCTRLIAVPTAFLLDRRAARILKIAESVVISV